MWTIYMSDKTIILITGANRGIGLEFVKQLSLRHVEVIGTYRNEKGAKDLLDLTKTHDHVHAVQADVTDELLSEAKKDIELILEGKDPGINYSATTGYLQYVNDWILDNSEDLKPEVKAKLEAYFDKLVPVAMRNAEKKQFQTELVAGQIPPAEGLVPKTSGQVPITLPPNAPTR